MRAHPARAANSTAILSGAIIWCRGYAYVAQNKGTLNLKATTAAKRVYRLYREMGLQLRNKTPKRRVQAKLREDRQSATRPNETWAMDFVHDQLATGRKLRVLTIIDTESLKL